MLDLQQGVTFRFASPVYRMIPWKLQCTRKEEEADNIFENDAAINSGICNRNVWKKYT